MGMSNSLTNGGRYRAPGVRPISGDPRMVCSRRLAQGRYPAPRACQMPGASRRADIRCLAYRNYPAPRSWLPPASRNWLHPRITPYTFEPNLIRNTHLQYKTFVKAESTNANIYSNIIFLYFYYCADASRFP